MTRPHNSTPRLEPPDEPDGETCPDCEGSGWGWRMACICPTCNGTGTVTPDPSDAWDAACDRAFEMAGDR